MHGFTDLEEFKIHIGDKEYPINTQEEKRKFALVLIWLLSNHEKHIMDLESRIEKIRDVIGGA